MSKMDEEIILNGLPFKIKQNKKRFRWFPQKIIVTDEELILNGKPFKIKQNKKDLGGFQK